MVPQSLNALVSDKYNMKKSNARIALFHVMYLTVCHIWILL